MIYKIAPKYGKKNPLYYLSICAVTGSVSVCSKYAANSTVIKPNAERNRY